MTTKMAAPIVMKCQLCDIEIKSKNYRSLTSYTAFERWGELYNELTIHPTGFSCSQCTNKLNRASSIAADVKSKVEKLVTERHKTISILRDMPGVKAMLQKVTTPRSSGGKSVKRSCSLRSPSGVTPKSKKTLFHTPRKTVTRIKTPLKVRTTVEIGTQTMVQKDFNVKIVVKSAKNVERSKIITDSTDKAVVKTLMNSGTHHAVVKHLSKKESYRNEFTKFVGKQITSELAQLSKRSSSSFKVASVDDLTGFKWEDQLNAINEKLPTLSGILKSVIMGKKKREVRLAVAVSILLYTRCQLLNLLQFVLGLVLDSSGLNKQGLNIIHDLGLSVSATSVRNKKKMLMMAQQQKVGNLIDAFKDRTTNTIEIIGDNLDISIAPKVMTMDKQRKSLHWFLTMVKQRRVTYEDMNIQGPPPAQDNIMSIHSYSYIPSEEQMQSVKKNFVFHISHILLKYIKFIQEANIHYPEYISHPFIEKTKTKSTVLNCSLIEESENSNAGMITILEKVHEIVVPHLDNEISQKVVFGGDVLTNIRAFTAQEAMQNNDTPFDCVLGIIHRPEGLHRQFNFLSAIYKLFYKEGSARDQGSLYNLRNVVNRRDVTGSDDVVKRFRPHHHFIDDVLDAYIVGTFLDKMEMDMMDGQPRTPVLLNLMSDDSKVEWLNGVATEIVNELNICECTHFSQLRRDLHGLSSDDTDLDAMKSGAGEFKCPLCNKSYKVSTWFKKHLRTKHNWEFHTVDNEVDSANSVHHFLFMALLFRDTVDSYKLGDGDRIVTNAYFEWLYDASLKHTHYKQWLWRMISYVISLLGFKESFEYKWNMSVNLKGGIKNNIPNDNCVELQVNNIKKELDTQGANKSFESAKVIAMTTQVIDSVKQQLLRTTKTARSKGDRPLVDKCKDINQMVVCLRKQGFVREITWPSFSMFKDPIQCIDADDLHAWINQNKKIANVYMK